MTCKNCNITKTHPDGTLNEMETSPSFAFKVVNWIIHELRGV